MYQRLWRIVLIAAFGVATVTAAPVSATSVGTTPNIAAGSSASSTVNAPLDIPETLVNSGTVSDFSSVNTVIYWHSAGSCYTPPAGPTQPTLGDVPESVVRVSTIFASPTRELYHKDLRATNSCH